MITLREFTPKDLYPIIEIVRESLREEYNPNFYIHLHNLWPEGFILAEQNKNIVGFINGVKTTYREARILMLAVQKEMRNRGIGTQLVESFINYCNIGDIKFVTLEVRVSNEIAIRFYTRMGFVITNLLPRFYKDGDDGYQMWKNL